MKLDRKLYHSNDLAILWGISNKNTLYTTIKRYVKKGILVSIFKGLYATVQIPQLDPLELGRAIIHNTTYLTTETVLAKHGIIAQTTYMYTFVGGVSKKVTVKGITFLFRKLKETYLNNPAGIETKDGVYVASVERAIADMLYFNPKYHFDLLGDINWVKVKEIQKEVGYL